MTDAPPAATSMTAADAPTPGGWGDLTLAGTTPGAQMRRAGRGV